MTLSLRELQRAFAAGVFSDAPDVLAHIHDGAFPAARHMQIYRHNTFVTLTDALAADFPVVCRLVGEGFFAYAADGYIRRYPLSAGNLHDFGMGFADFLATFPPARALPYLPDMARLEWAWQEAYHAADAESFSFNALGAVSPERYGSLVFRLQPSVRLVASDYPILRIWQLNQPDHEGDEAIRLDQGPERVLVVRQGIEVELEALGPGDYALLRAFASRAPLAVAGERALAADAGFDLAARLRHFVARGAIAGFTLDEPPADSPDRNEGLL